MGSTLARRVWDYRVSPVARSGVRQAFDTRSLPLAVLRLRVGIESYLGAPIVSNASRDSEQMEQTAGTEQIGQRHSLVIGYKCFAYILVKFSSPSYRMTDGTNVSYKEINMNPFIFLSQIQQMGDPRTRDYPLVMNPFFVFPMIATYLYFVKVAGPRWMKNRKPFEITNLMRFYNVAMVILNARFLYIVLINTYLPGGRYSLWCQGITGYMDDQLAEYYKSGWWYLAVRYADLLDTVFFVLRKKFTHITHLHVIHHALFAANAWLIVLFAPEGQGALGLAMNAFVHVIMYTYYFLATLGPSVAQYLWWKRYLTMMQIAQFVIFIIHMSIPLFVDCGFPRYLIVVGIVQTILIMVLFVNFYVKSYYRKPIASKARNHTSLHKMHEHNPEQLFEVNTTRNSLRESFDVSKNKHI
ncbi:elongation of very long chain fatty acids protein AAEL008004 [Ixodes scapularis]